MFSSSKGVSAVKASTAHICVPSFTAFSSRVTTSPRCWVPRISRAPVFSSSAPFRWARQPHSTTSLRGCSLRRRRAICMDFLSPVPVTVQVLTTYTSASSFQGTMAYPASRNFSSMAWVSYWFTLQPSVWKATVFKKLFFLSFYCICSKRHINMAMDVMAAVSVRRILGPKVTARHPCAAMACTSSADMPPSGPMTTATSRH